MTQRRVRILKRKKYRLGKRDDTEKGYNSEKKEV